MFCDWCRTDCSGPLLALFSIFFSFLLAVLVSPGLPFRHSNHDAHSKFVFTSMRLNFFSQHFCFLGFWTGSTVSIMNY